MKKILVIASAIALCGCSVFGPATPTTYLKTQVGNQTFAWECPKQFEAEGLEFTVYTNGTAAFKVGKVHSFNDPLVIDKSYAGQAFVIKQMGDTTTQIMESAGTLAAKGMSPTNAPVTVKTNATDGGFFPGR